MSGLVPSLAESAGVDAGRAVLERSVSVRTQLLESTAEGICSVDVEGRCTYVNRAAAALLGYAPADLIGANFHERCHHTHADGAPYAAADCPITRALARGEGCRIDGEVFWKRDGTPVDVTYWSFPIREDGVLRGAGVCFVDATARRSTEIVLRRHREELQFLRDVAIAANEAPSSDQALKVALDGVCKHMGWTSGRVFTKDATGALTPSDIRYGDEAASQRDSALSTRVLARAESMWIEGDASKPHGEAVFAFPVFVGTEVVAVIECASANATAPDAAFRDLASQVGTQLGRVFERERAERQQREANRTLAAWVEQLERRNREISLINEMVDVLQSCRTNDETNDVIAQYAGRFFPGGSGMVSTTNAARTMLEAAATWGDIGADARVFALHECWAIRRGQAHRVEPGRPALRCRHLDPDAHTNEVCIPMMAQGEALGVLHLRMPSEGAEEADIAYQLAHAVAEHIALAMANFRLRETLRAQSIRDPLTGVFNRRYLEESLERELRRCARHQRPLTVIGIDVDFFKRVNDTFGHDGGDSLLRALGAYFRSNVRVEDIVCRFGGEEFFIVMPDGDPAGCLRRAEALREGVKRMNVMHRAQSIGAVTVSMGIATMPMTGSTVDEMIRTADQALYKAKGEGRDRVVFAGEAVPAPPAA